MLVESDQQSVGLTGGKPITHVIIPVGAGSIAQAVTQHFKDSLRVDRAGRVCVIGVEPTTAASLKMSLQAGENTTVDTEDTIMAGMNCGTLSTIAWPVLKKGIDACALVSDLEAHESVDMLRETKGINAGPCGAAPVAALKILCRSARAELGFTGDSVVILYCTEGSRGYEIPHQE